MKGCSFAPTIFRPPIGTGWSYSTWRTAAITRITTVCARFNLNEEAVGNYQYQVASCLARMRDGTVVSFDLGQEPDRLDTKPELDRVTSLQKNLEEKFSEGATVTVCLALPKLELGRANVTYEDAQANERYRSRAMPLHEESRGGDVQDIELRSLNVRLLVTPAEDVAGYEILPISKIKRAGEESSYPQIDDEYIPPILAIDAWPRLMRELEGLYHFIGQNIDTLSQQVISRGITLAAQEPGDLERVFKLQVLNAAYTTLRCMVFAAGVHPYDAYAQLCQQVGLLSIFGEDRRVPDCPVYDHDDIGPVFAWLVNQIKLLVEAGRQVGI